MAASDSEEFESADEDYKCPEQKTIKRANVNLYTNDNTSEIIVKNDEKSEQIISELKSNEIKECHDKIAHEAPKESQIAGGDGWDDFGDEEWIDSIPENKDVCKKNESKSIEIPANKYVTTEAFVDETADIANKIDTVSISSQKNSTDNEPTSSWGVWKPWGGIVSSVFSAASEGVTTLTTLIETGIGAPDPGALVKINKENESIDSDTVSDDKSIKSNKSQDTNTIHSLGHLVSGVTSIGNKVITGGLDTLEGIGKKTMNILQENDPLLLQKRKFIGLESGRPNLSQVLREAKVKSEEVEKNMKQMQKQAYKKQLHFESLFDNYYGLVHLEALEMLSKQAAIKLQSLLDPLSGKALTELKETLNEVNELCDLGELDINDTETPFTVEELQEKLESATEDLGMEINFDEILKCWKRNIDQLENTKLNSQEIFEYGLRCLAETCALQINKMHKIAELLIIKEHHSTANEADSLVQMTTIYCHHLHGIANKFCCQLNTFEQNEELSSSITNLFLEVYNSTSYIQSAFKLFIPILQVGAA